MTDSTIATVSLAQPLDTIAEALGRSFEDYGFAVIRDHGIPQDLIERAEEKSKEFFALPLKDKLAHKIAGGGGARGYTPFGIEKAKDAEVFDLKEFWHVGRDLPADHPLAEFMAPNVWPDEIDGFRETFTRLYAAFEGVGAQVLEAIALHLDLPREWFAATIADGNSVMRLLHYPPLTDERAEGAIRAAAHGDINTITLLLGGRGSRPGTVDRRRRMAGHRGSRRRLGGKHRRHAGAVDQREASFNQAPRGQSDRRGGIPRALFDAILPALST